MTYFEQQAERLLASRGEQNVPRPLASDLARWLEEAHNEGFTAGVSKAVRIIRDARVDFEGLERSLKEAAKP